MTRQGRFRPPRFSIAPQLRTHSYTILTDDNDDQAHDGHRSRLHNRPQFVPSTSYRGTEGHSYTYGVCPQQVETWQLLQRPDGVENRLLGGV